MPAQPEPTDRAEVWKLAAAVEAALAAEMKTSARSDDPSVPSWADGPRIGAALPVPQPGIPPMSQQATDIGRTALYCGLATVPPGLVLATILLASGQANPTVVAWICTAPAALAVPILAVARLLRSAKEVVEAAPAEVHNHYTGPVHQDQRNVTNTTSWWGKSPTHI